MLVVGILDISASVADSFIRQHVLPVDVHYTLRFRSGRRRRQSLGARAMLRHLLVQKWGELGWGCEFRTDHQGHPVLENAPIPFPHISLSHSRDFVAAAVTDIGPLGVDIEWAGLRRTSPTELIRFMIDSSLWGQVKIDNQAEFYRLWTIIESIVKATRTLPPITPNSAIFTKSRLPSIERLEENGDTLWIGQARVADYAFGLAIRSSNHLAQSLQWQTPINENSHNPIQIIEFH